MIGSIQVGDALATMDDSGVWSCPDDPALEVVLRALYSVVDYSPAHGEYGKRQVQEAADRFGVDPIFIARSPSGFSFAGFKTFDESKIERDERGRFAPTGGGSSGGSDDGGGSSVDDDDSPITEAERSHAISPVVAKVERRYPPADSTATETNKRFVDSAGKLTPQRQKLHNTIAAKVRSNIKPATGDKIYTLMGGGPASGKSSIIKAGVVTLPEEYVHIDSDAIKGDLPEYKAMVDAKDVRAAAYVHEESSALAKRVQAESLSAGQHVVLDGTGNGSIKGVEQKTAAARAAGYKVHAEYVTCSTQEALRRNMERAKKTGRMPPESMLKATHKSVSQVLPEAVEKGLYDKVRLWDSEKLTDGKPTLVMSAEGNQMTVHDKDLWEAFKAKATENL